MFLEGTEDATIEGSTFERLDGNALMISGYNRNATVQDSSFAFIGNTAIASWGRTSEFTGYKGFGDGFDGTPVAAREGGGGRSSVPARGVRGRRSRSGGGARLLRRADLDSGGEQPRFNRVPVG